MVCDGVRWCLMVCDGVWCVMCVCLYSVRVTVCVMVCVMVCVSVYLCRRLCLSLCRYYYACVCVCSYVGVYFKCLCLYKFLCLGPCASFSSSSPIVTMNCNVSQHNSSDP